MPSTQTRAYLYRIAVAVIPVLIAFGYLTSDVASLVLTVAAAVLGVGTAGLAAANTSTRP